MPRKPRFASDGVRNTSDTCLAWAIDQSETKRPILAMSLGKSRTQPPGIHFAPGRTREFSLLPPSALIVLQVAASASLTPLSIMPRI